MRWSSSHGRRSRGSLPRKRTQPIIEPCEPRALLAQGVTGHASIPLAQVSPLAAYTTLVVRVERGPRAGRVLAGPVVLGQSDAHGQVIGFLYQANGPRLTLVGGIFGRRVALRLVVHGGAAIELSGIGQLRRVAGGLPGGLDLLGTGPASGPGRNDAGHWVTLGL